MEPGDFADNSPAPARWKRSCAHPCTALSCSQKPLSIALVYPFGGFQAPIDGQPTLNTAKAGAVIPVNFTLGGDHGLGILAPGSPSSTRFDCGTATDLDEIEETASVGSGLSYDPETGAYMYKWRTSRGSGWAGTCRAFDLELADGTHHQVLFSFR